MGLDILLLSDSHGYTDDNILKHAQEVDEIWHAGDWGDSTFSDTLEQFGKVRGVFGNIDGTVIRKTYPKQLLFECEGLKVFMIHIGGYPGRYAKGVKELLKQNQVKLFISGHSHICKIVRDNELDLMHFNPGAVGNNGFHKKRTMLRFSIVKGKIENLRVLEYEKNYQNRST